MNTDANMKRWLPCSSSCGLAGATSFFVSIKNSAVLLNAPRWCSIIVESEITLNDKKYEPKIFCSDIQELDLLYGAENVLHEALKEVDNELEPEVIAVLNSCAVSLIGADIEGVCNEVETKGVLIPLDVGGINGEFWDGYNIGICKMLEVLNFKKEVQNKNNVVNIIGISPTYPNWKGDLEEIKRLLKLASIEINICVGEDDVSLNDLRKIPKANLNLVLYPELGLDAAKILEKDIGQKYLISPVPYGFNGSLKWLMKICDKLNINANLKQIKAEIKDGQERIDKAYFTLKGSNKRIEFGDAYLCLTEGVAYSLTKALSEEFPELYDIYLRIEGPCSAEFKKPEGIYEWGKYADIKNEDNTVDLVFGNEQSRIERKEFEKIIYKNFIIPSKYAIVRAKPYAGIIGWEFLLEDIFKDFQDKIFINKIC